MRRLLAAGGCFAFVASAAVAASCGSSSSGVGAGDAGADGPLAEASGFDAGPPDDPAVRCADFSVERNVYWGELHVHTALSADAYGVATRNMPLDALRWASSPSTKLPISGATSPPGPKVSIDRALDFSVITDHSEWLMSYWGCGVGADGGPLDPGSPIYSSALCGQLRAEKSTQAFPLGDAVTAYACGDGGFQSAASCAPTYRSAWQSIVAAVHAANQPCKFTSLLGYEWTKQPEHLVELHQNVIFATETAPPLPFDSNEYTTLADLWSTLDQTCVADAGCTAITIPHNTNFSAGGAFVIPAGVAAQEQMSHYQRLVEIHQHKGNSECVADGRDPACAFEHVPEAGGATENPQNFVRTALENGLEAYAANREASGDAGAIDPMQMGIVGGSDDHNGLPGYVKEDTWEGHRGETDDTPAERLLEHWYFNPGGMTGVWAEQNSRAAIFAALQRRETFGTSGPRIAVRFYQVWNATDYCGADAGGPGFPGDVLAAGGVPMGATMPAGPGTGKPHFVVSALKDEADLAEVDVIKATVVGGAIAETVQRLTPSSAGGIWSGGSVCLNWTDATFDPKSPALYYVRVLQAPTWRWSHYDCQAAPGTTGCGDGGLDTMIQERAWTSPIWWLP